MSKNWFVLKGSHHLGPFEPDDLYNMFHQGKIDEESMIWRDGDSDWKSLKDCQELYDALNGSGLFDQLNGPPPVPAHLKRATKSRPSVDELSPYPELAQVEEVPPLPLPPGGLQEKMNDFHFENKTELENIDEYESEVDVDAFEMMDHPFEVEQKVEADPLDLPDPMDEPPQFFHEAQSEEVEPEIKPEIKEVVETVQSQNDLQIDEFPTAVPPIPVEESISKDSAAQTLEAEQVDLDFLDKETKKGSRFLRTIFALVCLSVVLLTSLYLFLNTQSSPTKLTGLSESKMKKLMGPRNSSLANRPVMSFSLNDVGTSIWATANVPGDLNVELYFQSVKNKTIGNSNISFTSFGLLKNKTIELKEFLFTTGNKIVPGLYEVRVKAVDLSTQGKILGLLKKTGLFEFVDRVKYFQPTWFFNGKFILSKTSEKDLAKSIVEKNKENRIRIIRPITARIEKYTTFKQLLNTLYGLYSDELKVMKKRGTFRSFEKKYAVQVAPILQSVIIDQSKVEVVNLKELENIRPNNDDLKKFGKHIGALAVEMVEKTEMLRKINSKSKSKIKNYFKNKFETLDREGDRSIEALRKAIKVHKSSN